MIFLAQELKLRILLLLSNVSRFYLIDTVTEEKDFCFGLIWFAASAILTALFSLERGLIYYILRNLSEKQIFHGLTLFNIKQLLLRITKQKSTFLTVAMLICCNTLLMLFCNILLEIRAEDKFIPEVAVSIYSKSNINILDYLNKHIDTQNTFESYAQGHLYTV